MTGDRRLFESDELGARFLIDARFADILPGCPAPGAADSGAASECAAGDAASAARRALPTAHFLASQPAAGRIAALAVVTVESEPQKPDEWLAGQLARAQASFGAWSPEAHEMLIAPEAGELAGRPALHVRYRLIGGGDDGGDGDPGAEGAVPPSLVEHWTVLVAERSWLLAFELMVQPSGWWEEERGQLELPFRTLELVS